MIIQVVLKIETNQVNKTSMLRSYLCDFRDAYVVFKGTITATDLLHYCYK